MLPDGAEKVRFATCCCTPVVTQNSSRHVCLSPSSARDAAGGGEIGPESVRRGHGLVRRQRHASGAKARNTRHGKPPVLDHPVALSPPVLHCVALRCFAFRCSLTHGRRYVSRDGRRTDPMGSKRHPRRRRHLLTSPSRHRPNPPAPPGHLLRAHDRDEGQPQAPAQGACPHRCPTRRRTLL